MQTYGGFVNHGLTPSNYLCPAPLGSQKYYAMSAHHLFMVMATLVFSCTPSDRNASLAPSIGGEYEVVVVVDDEMKAAPHVEALKAVLARAYPMLNQPEPWFSMRWIDVDNVNEMTRRERYLILLSPSQASGKVRSMAMGIFGKEAIENTERNGKAPMLTGSDAWVRPQSVMYWSGSSPEELAKAIDQHADKILSFFDQKEFARIHHMLFEHNRRTDLEAEAQTELGILLQLPEIYEVAKLGKPNLLESYQELGIDGFKWYFSKSRHAFNNIAVWSVPYTDSVQLRRQQIIDMRNKVLGTFVPCEDEGSVMGTETRFKDLMPQVEVVRLNGNYAVRTTGFWRAEGGFQGGPFVNYAIVDEDKGRIIFADGSVAAKGQPKKKYVVRLKCILSTVKPI
jgi:hypothetical protein